MNKGRLETFSDGVIAIIITIMVLNLTIPRGSDLGALRGMAPGFLTYLVSFVYLGTYWNNHHHLLLVTERVSGGILWANLHLLFWLSLIPVATAWIAATDFAHIPTAVYATVLLFAAVAYYVLQTAITRLHGPDSRLARALRRDYKGKLSLFCYVIAIPLAFVGYGISEGLIVLVALIWLIPDRRIEAVLEEGEDTGKESNA